MENKFCHLSMNVQNCKYIATGPCLVRWPYGGDACLASDGRGGLSSRRRRDSHRTRRLSYHGKVDGIVLLGVVEGAQSPELQEAVGF